MRYSELVEMPIAINHLDMRQGDQSSFRDDDHALTTREKPVSKIKRIWRSSVADVDLYLVDVQMEPTRALNIAVDDGGHYDHEHPGVRDLSRYADRIKANPESISVVLTQNEGSGRVPLTGWMIAHRMFHTFQSDKKGPLHHAGGYEIAALMITIAQQYQAVLGDFTGLSGLPSKDIICLVGTSAACRNYKLTNSQEILPECFAQYMLRGAVTLNRLKGPALPDRDGKPHPIDDEHIEYLNNTIGSFERYLNRNYAELITMAMGKVFGL